MENFRSFDRPVEVDFTVKPEKATQHGYVATPTGEVVSRINVFFGANASGKTNLLKALAFLHWAITESAKTDAKQHDYLIPFWTRLAEPITLGVEISYGTESLFRYTLKTTSKLLFLEERLEVRPGKRAEWKNIFHRSVSPRGEISFSPDSDPEWAQTSQRPNASLIGSRLLAGDKPGIDSEGLKLARNLSMSAQNSYGNVSPEYGPNSTQFLWGILGSRLQANDTLKQQASVFMQNADLGISDVSLRKVQTTNSKTGEPSEVTFPFLVHEFNGQKVPLPFNLESGGTQTLLQLFAETYPTALDSGVISLDEIECGIHPHMIPKLVEALTPPDSTSQLNLVTHCDYLLRYLEHDQVFLTEKLDSGGTEIYRADTVEGFKVDRNLLSWYHAGKLGAIPRL